MGFFGDLFSHPLNALKQVADFAAPVASFLPGGAEAEGAFNLFNNAFNHGQGGSGGYGFGNLTGGGGGFAGSGAGGFDPNIAALFRTPYGQNMLYGDPTSMGGPGYRNQLGVGDQLRNYGGDLLGKGMNGLPGLGTGQMGALDNIPGVMDQQARMTGVASPFGNFAGASDPYSLDPASQAAYTNQADMINQSRDSQVADMKNQMMANGVTDPRTLAAMEAQIHSAHDAQANTLHANMMQSSFGNRLNTLQGFNGTLGNLYNSQFGQQQSNLGHGGQFLEGAGGLYGQGANNAIGMNNVRDSSLGALMGLGLGRGMYGYSGGGYGLPPLSAQQGNNAGQAAGSGLGDIFSNIFGGQGNTPANDYLGVNNPWGGFGGSNQSFAPGLGDYNWNVAF